MDSYEVIKVSFDSFNIQYSLNFRPKGKHEGRNRELGICILYSNYLRHSESKVIGRLLFPERILHTTLILDNREINIVGFHSLTGCDYKKTKTAQFLSLADYIEENSIDFICFDSNEPEVDYGDVYKNKYFKQLGNTDIGARTFFEIMDKQGLKDSYIPVDRNIEPLAVSHIVKGKKTPRRYDYIYCKKENLIIETKYLYEESILAGSDHALITSLQEI